MVTMKKTILCFGDSNTHGYNSSNNGRFTEDERWTCLLSKYLGDNYSVKEEGLSGRTTVFSDPLFEGLDGISYISPSLLTHEPIDLLIIMLGTNDTKERFSATSQNISRGLERLTQKAISTTGVWKSNPNILLIAPLPIEIGYENTSVSGEMGKGCAEKSKALASLYKEVAERNKCHFLDSSSIKGMTMYPYDYIHFSKESHQLLAYKLSKIIPDIC
ncbi:GDSL-type esterase/lipase family protein [Clostridium sp.]|uniref:GDSL-type esterase/lipase family protein n=1 Tax=Clostridium sp. TaxID=1506 RepID=UPI0034440F10